MSIQEEAWNALKTTGPTGEDELWELFHENSKLDPYAEPPQPKAVYERVVRLFASLPYDTYPNVPLAEEPAAPAIGLFDCLRLRETQRTLEPAPISFAQLSTILLYGYGVMRSNEGTGVPRPFRAVPSAGGLYPLEVYIATSEHVADVEPGLYHYNSAGHHLTRLRQGAFIGELANRFIQSELVSRSSLLLLVTGVFQRTVFKYKARGYRYVLLEAGHLGQNLGLVAASMDLGVINLGGFQDRDIDRFLEIDGVNHSTIYTAAIGARAQCS